jgi:septum formation protein
VNLSLNTLLRIDTPIVLASASPRRKKLLEQINLEFTVHPSDVNENELSTGLDPAKYVQTLALCKAQDVASVLAMQSLSQNSPQGALPLVIGSDTTVVLNNVILNKPTDAADARRMLRGLSGCVHKVFTGIALVDTASKRSFSDVCATNVYFRALQDVEIEAYIATGSPLDKAGGYGIQDDFGAVFVERVEGCYYNVVGLPLAHLYRALQNFFADRVNRV